MRIAYLQIISTLDQKGEESLREALSQKFPEFSFWSVQGASTAPGCVFLTLTGDQDDANLLSHMADFLWSLVRDKEITWVKVSNDRNPDEAQFRIAA